MDEEQALESPIAGGIRGIRRTVSSSIFAGRRAPEQVQPDSITTNLLQQNSLSLNNVSGQLTNISSQVAGLNGSLLAIKDNLSLSDTLERQRETARQNREAILAEQGLREGKESQIESRIQNALTFPVRRLAQKTQFALSRLTNFFLILAGGWLTNTVINLIRATSDGNIDLMNQLKTALTRALVVAGGTLLALSLGFKRIIQGIGFLGTTAFRIGRGAFLRKPLLSFIIFAISDEFSAVPDICLPSLVNSWISLAVASEDSICDILAEYVFPLDKIEAEVTLALLDFIVSAPFPPEAKRPYFLKLCSFLPSRANPEFKYSASSLTDLIPSPGSSVAEVNVNELPSDKFIVMFENPLIWLS